MECMGLLVAFVSESSQSLADVRAGWFGSFGCKHPLSKDPKQHCNYAMLEKSISDTIFIYAMEM